MRALFVCFALLSAALWPAEAPAESCDPSAPLCAELLRGAESFDFGVNDASPGGACSFGDLYDAEFGRALGEDCARRPACPGSSSEMSASMPQSGRLATGTTARS